MARKPHPLAPVGRPQIVKATPELVAAACADIAKGLPIESALVRQGIAPSTMATWRLKNPAVELAFATAETEFETWLVNVIRGHALKDTKAACWLAERRLRGQWAPPAGKVELTGKDGGPIQSLTISKTLLANVAQGADMPRPVRNVTPQGS